MSEPSESDELDALARRAADGDRDALETLLGALYGRIAAVTRRICGADHDDATQHALIAIARGIHRFDGRSAVTTWAYRIATNAALDEVRRRQRHGGHDNIDNVTLVDRHEQFDQLDDQVLIEHGLAQLSPDHRAAIVLRDVGGLDYGEIADIIDVPIGTVRSRIARARRHLADLLTEGNLSSATNVQTNEP